MTRDDLEQLATVRIATPCPMKWRDMTGDEKKRFCGKCQLHVHRLSALTTAEAAALLRRPDGARVCVEVFYRLDGTVMTKDCASAWAVGVSEAVRRVEPLVGVGTFLGAAAVFLLALGFWVVTLFTDNLRSLFSYAGDPLPATAVTRPVSRPASVK